MENETKEILKYLGNMHTKVELKEDFRGNYYSFLTDTIYIAKNFEEQKVPKAVKDINKKAAELIVVCHECVHSKQNKFFHILNTVLSNLSIVLAIICIVLSLFWTTPLWLKIITVAVVTASITIRLMLEVGAVNESTRLAVDVVDKGMTQSVSKQDIEASRKYMSKYKYVAIPRMVLDKIAFLILVVVLK